MNFKKVSHVMGLCIFATMLAGAAFDVTAAERYVDPIQKKIDLKHKSMLKELEKHCGSNNRVGCILNAKKEASELVPNRGSVAYSKKAYGNLSKSEAKIKVGQLIKLFDKVDGQLSRNWVGKLDKRHVEAEIRWLMSEKLHQPSPDIITARMYLGLPVR